MSSPEAWGGVVLSDRRVSTPFPAASEHPAEAAGAYVGRVCGRRALWRRQRRGLVAGDGQRDRALGDARHLRRVDEALPVLGVDHDPVEDVLALGLEDLPDAAKLETVRA